MARKDYRVDEVVRALTNKGCTITLDIPITKQVTDVEYTSRDVIGEKYDNFLKEQDQVKLISNVASEGEDKTNEKYFKLFKKRNRRLFEGRGVRRDIVVQAPYTINIHNAHELGNGSWGKIDFLTNHRDFILINQGK